MQFVFILFFTHLHYLFLFLFFHNIQFYKVPCDFLCLILYANDLRLNLYNIIILLNLLTQNQLNSKYSQKLKLIKILN